MALKHGLRRGRLFGGTLFAGQVFRYNLSIPPEPPHPPEPIKPIGSGNGGGGGGGGGGRGVGERWKDSSERWSALAWEIEKDDEEVLLQLLLELEKINFL